MAGRRPGDAEILYASTAKAEKELNWKYIFYAFSSCNSGLCCLVSCLSVGTIATAERSMASKRCAMINGTGLARTPGDTDRLTLLTEEALFCDNSTSSTHLGISLIVRLHVNVALGQAIRPSSDGFMNK